MFEERYWKTVGQFSEHGFNLERYDQIRISSKRSPCSDVGKRRRRFARSLAVTVGRAERFLEDRLTDTLVRLKEPFLRCETKSAWEKRLTLSCTVAICIGDTVMLAGQDGPFTTHIKGLKRLQGMAEMRDAGKRWVNFDTVEAAVSRLLLRNSKQPSPAQRCILRTHLNRSPSQKSHP